MELADLNTLVIVAREQSFSRAARLLNRTQPAISLAVRRLEQRAGTPLFSRETKRPALTEAGRVLVAYAQQMCGVQDEARLALSRLRDLRCGMVSVGVDETWCGALLPALAAFRQAHPHVTVALQPLAGRGRPRGAGPRGTGLPKDYVRYKLTGAYAIDKADGAGMLLFDLKARDWSPEVLSALNIPPAYLPPTHEGPAITGYLSHEAAVATGLRTGIPVMAGGGDQAAGAVGVGAVQSGIVSLAMGTSGVVFATTSGPFIEPEGRLHAFCHAVPGRWHFMGVMLSAAGSLRWHRDTLAPGMSYDDLLRPAADVPIGCEGLLFLPYLTGERTPHPDPLARGAFVGLTVRHGLPHMTRAVLEGVAFGLRDSFELIKSGSGAAITQVRVSGGGAKSPLWRQILADVMNAELVTVNTTEGAAYGAALLAGVGAGVWHDVDAACRRTITVTGSTAPDPAHVAAYESAYARYGELYPALAPIFHRL